MYALRARGTHRWIAYLGAASAGVPIAVIVQRYGWNAYFATMLGAAVVVLLLLAPMTNLKSFAQREAEADAKAA
jgi:MFS transporter, OPA family, sugar phosphate sensor protein UhpC